MELKQRSFVALVEDKEINSCENITILKFTLMEKFTIYLYILNLRFGDKICNYQIPMANYSQFQLRFCNISLWKWTTYFVEEGTGVETRRAH